MKRDDLCAMIRFVPNRKEAVNKIDSITSKIIELSTELEELKYLLIEAEIQEPPEGRMADIPTTKTDVLSAKIAKAP